jgi:hypothetical protein
MKKLTRDRVVPIYIRQSFLRDLRNQSFRLTRLAKLRHQKENSRQTLFAGIEQLIDKISLGSHTPGQQKR